MNDEEIGLNFFTEGEPRTPDGLPSVFGAIDQAEMLARIDDVQDDDLAGSFFSDSLIEVEEAATRVFDVGVRARAGSAQSPEPSTAESSHVEQFVVEALPTEPVVVEHTVLEHRVVEEKVVEETAVTDSAGAHTVIEHSVVEQTTVEETVIVETSVGIAQSADDEASTEIPALAAPVSRLGAAREDVVAMPSRTVITVPGILAKSADARRSFILGGPAAVGTSQQQ